MLNRNLLYTVCSLCNKNLIVRALTCFLIFIGFVDAHTFTITGETAQKIVIDNIISDNIGKVDVYFLRNSAQKYVCDKEKRLQLFHGKEIDFPYENNWVFFVDDYPPMNWFHPCRYIFIDPQTGNYKIVQHEVYPENLREDYDLVVEMPRPNNNLLQKASKSAEIQTVTTAVSNPNLYAVIISGTDEDQYWRDISAIYCTLNQVYGFTKDNIFVHYAEGRANLGHDLDDPEDPSYDFDYSAYKGNIERTFKNLTGEWTNDTNVPALDINDHLYVFVTDHGGLGQGGHTYIVLPNDVDLYDYELAEYVDALNCAQITFVMQQCFSGGFIDDLTDYDTYDVKCKHRTIHTACDYDEYSICEMHISDWKYDEFIFYWTAAARGYYPVIDEPWNVDQDAPVGSFSFNSISTLISHPSDYDPDLNSDGKIQMEEAFDYANNFDTWSEYGYYCPYPTPPYCYYTESPQDVNNIGFEEDLLCLEGISGTIENSQCVEGNFLICDDLEIDNNTALDIHDSTTFHFVDGASLTVNGSMNVIGTSSSLIVFTSANASPSIGDWEGIRFLESVYEECQIQYATFEYADTAISIKDCSPNINNSQINNCVYGIKVTGSNADPTISYMDIEDNSRGVFFGKNASGILSYSSVIDNTYGIQIDNSEPVIQGNYIHDNNYGIRVSYSYTQSWTQNHILNNNINDNSYGIYLWDASPTVYNNQIIYNNYGLRNYNSSSPIVTGNDIQYNQYYGFYCSYYSNPVLNYSSSQDFGGYNNISLNGTYGIQVANNAAPVIGLPNPNYGGFNSIFSNSSYEIRNSTTSTVFASNNWWGNPNGPSSGELYGSVYWNPPLSESPGGGIESLVFTSEKDSDVPRDLINAYIEKCNINYEESAELFNKYFSENPNSQFTSFAVEEYIEVLLSSGMTIEDILTEIQSISEQNICDSINYQLSLSQILLNIRIVDFDSALKLLDIMLEETKNKDRLNWLLIQKGHIYTYCLNSPESGINYFETVLSNSDEKSDVFILAYEEINNIENGSTIKLFKQKGGDVVSALCPTEYRLYNNYPNPFNPTTTIRYDIPEASHVIITIYNMNGKVVDRLVNQKQGQGFYSVQWNARNVSTGVYFYQIKTDGFQQVNKMLLIK